MTPSKKIKLIKEAFSDLHYGDLSKDEFIAVVSVIVYEQDLLIGFRKKNFMIEIKNPEYARSKKTGEVKASSKRKSQKKLDIEWQGQRDYCFTLDDVLRVIGYKTNE